MVSDHGDRGHILREGAAELAGRVQMRLEAEAERMEQECSHPPCIHAQGVRLAAEWATAEFCDLVNEMQDPADSAVS